MEWLLPTLTLSVVRPSYQINGTIVCPSSGIVLSRCVDLKETHKVWEHVKLRQQVLQVLVKEVMVVIPEMETGNYET